MSDKNDTTPELLPCPFCGGKPEKVHYIKPFFPRAEKTYAIRCLRCRAETKEARTRITPVRNWNRRA